MRKLLLFSVGFVLPTVALAQPAMIEGTTIVDTPQNRTALEVCDKYRVAVERRDPRAVLRFVSARYHDDAGTPDPEDDVDLPTLKRSLSALLSQLEAVTYRVRFVALRRLGSRVEVDVQYTGTFRINGRDHVRTDRHTIALEQSGGRTLIVSGL